jgi:signal transduction histidine kinase
LTASRGLGYPDRVRPEREEIAAQLVTSALAAGEAGAAYGRLVDTLRAAWGAERALLVRADGLGKATLVHQTSLPGAGEAPEPGALAAACGETGPVTLERGRRRHGGVIALGLRVCADERWCVALTRTATWTAADRRLLADLQRDLELVVEHARLREHLAAAAEREAEAATEHERFLSVISHELRNPLAPILMWTSTLRRLRRDDAEVQRAAAAIAHAVGLARRLIEQLLDLSRLERGVLEVVLEPLDLRALARHGVEQLRAAAAEAQVTVEQEIASDAVRARADAGRSAQVLAALLDNAIKFTPAGGRVCVAVGREGRHARLSVTDSGPGLPEDVPRRLFTPFVHGVNARGGLGLGLAIAHQLTALQHGTLTVANAPEGGVRAIVTLPLAG